MRERMILLLLILLAFGLRVDSLGAQSMWRDEVDTLCFASQFWGALEFAVQGQPLNPIAIQPTNLRCQPAPGVSQLDTSAGLFPALYKLFSMSGWNGPLYTLGMYPWIQLTGASDFALRYSSLLFGVLAMPLIYALGRRLLGAAVGLVGAALAATSPFLIWYSQEVKMYSITLSLGLLCLYALRRAIESGERRWWLLMVAASTLNLYTHILTALLIPLQFLLWLWWWPHSRRSWRWGLAAFALLTLPYLPLLLWQLPQWLRPTGEATLFNYHPLNSMLLVLVRDWSYGFLGDWATHLLAGLTLPVYVAFAALILAGMAWIWLTHEPEQPAMQERWREPLALLLWILLPAVLLWLISLRQPLFVSRYLIWATPAFYLLAAAGAFGLAQKRPIGLGLAIVLLGLIFLRNAQAYQSQTTIAYKPDFESAAVYLAEHHQPDELVMFHLSYIETNFDFYYPDDYVAAGAPAPGEYMSAEQLDRDMRATIGGRRRVWLVQSQSEMWDPGGRVQAWLDSYAIEPTEGRIFAHVSVYLYQLDLP